jgi:hypothetical protein
MQDRGHAIAFVTSTGKTLRVVQDVNGEWWFVDEGQHLAGKAEYDSFREEWRADQARRLLKPAVNETTA